MRPFLLLLLSCAFLLPVTGRAQALPNASFDNWFNNGGWDSPPGWLTSDDILGQQGQLLVTNAVQKTTDAHSGPYAAKLTTTTTNGLRIRGVLLLGTQLRSRSAAVPGGIAFTGRPTALRLHYKLTGPQAAVDSASVQVSLTRTVARSAVVVAYSRWYATTPTATYQQVDIPLSYNSATALPDSLHIICYSGNSRNPSPGTEFYLDDVELVSSPSGPSATRLPADEALAVYPDAYAEGHFFLQSAEPATQRAPLTVHDAIGRVVLRPEAAPAGTRRLLDLSRLPAGLYFIRVATPQGVLVRKVQR